MDWRKLDGPQRAVVRSAILDAFDDEASFNIFLNDKLNKKKLAVFAGGEDFEDRLFAMINEAIASGWINKLIPALQEYRGDSLAIQELPNAVRLARFHVAKRIESPELALEKVVRAGGFEHLSLWLDKMKAFGRAVCRIEFGTPEGKIYGTGFLVADDLVLTNYHLIEGHIEDGLAAKNLECRFDFAVDSKGLNQGFTVGLATKEAIIAYAAYDKEADVLGEGTADSGYLDFALLRLNESVGSKEVMDGVRRGHINMVAALVMPKPAEPVFILQHPNRRPIGISVGIVVETAKDVPRLRYDADTEDGSSGSPVFSQKLDLVALHQAGDPLSVLRPQYNQGIPIALIAAYLKEKGIEL